MKNTTKDKSFKNWTIEAILLTFGVYEVFNDPLLQQWLSVTHSLTPFEERILERLQHKAVKNIRFWNEAELRAKLIDPLTELINYEADEFLVSTFSERSLEISYKQTLLKGKVDWMVATGRSQPVQPFFFIHEYKKEKGNSDDPLAQLLAAMIAAHALHQNPPEPNLFQSQPTHFYKNMPIYGCYIVGRNWFFVTLDQNKYCVSKAYDATQMKYLKQIVDVLKTQKVWILEQLNEHGVKYVF